jgi:hypothetical protein
MRLPRLAVALVAACALLLVGCGKDNSALAQTERNLASVEAGTLDLRLAASAGVHEDETGPVGFHLIGPFSFDSSHELAVFDLTFTRLLGGDEQVSRVRSTGESAFVTVEGKSYKVPQADLASLRVSDDGEGGLSGLGIAGWVRNAKVTPGDKLRGELTDVITGEVDAGDMLSDLARVAESVGGATELAALNGDAAERLQKLVKSSSIQVITTAKSRQLRSLRAAVDFGTRAPAALRKSLGPYADARIEVSLALRSGSRNLRVSAPAL